MIRISTTQVTVGDTIRTYDVEGMVTKVPSVHSTRFVVHVDGAPAHMRDCGSVELLSDLNGRVPVESYGRW